MTGADKVRALAAFVGETDENVWNPRPGVAATVEEIEALFDMCAAAGGVTVAVFAATDARFEAWKAERDGVDIVRSHWPGAAPWLADYGARLRARKGAADV